MKISARVSMILILALIICMPTMASATIAYEFSQPGTTNVASWCLGFEFSTNATLTVAQLGFFDNNGDGLSQSHDVGIFDLEGNLLTSTTVTNSDPLVGHFRFHNIDTVTLAANTTYLIVAVTGSVDAYTFSPDNFLTDPSINFISTAYYSVKGTTFLACPDKTLNLTGIFGPNFSFESDEVSYGLRAEAPIPASLVLLGSGLLGLLGFARKKPNNS